MYSKVPAAELMNRLKKFTTLMDIAEDSWRYIFIFNPLNAYYLTGTMQDGVLFIQREEEPEYFVFRSSKRAEEETRYCKITEVKQYEDIKHKLSLNTFFPAFVDKEFTPMAFIERFAAIFEFGKILSCDKPIRMCRSVKSKYELDIIRKAGGIHQNIMENIAPSILVEDISELEAAAAIYGEFLKAGHQGIIRMERAGAEFGDLSIAFGESGLKTYRHYTPFGISGRYAATPFLGSPDIKLKQNDLINIKSYFALEGYHSSMTVCMAFNSLIEYVRRQYEHCLMLRDTAREMLKPGTVISDIYKEVADNIHPEIQGLFMGIGSEAVRSIGCGIGLAADEYPDISKDNDMPLAENMTVSITVQASLEGYGAVGVENTYIVTSAGGESVNGDNSSIIVAGRYL